jgi:hypothetical protein
MNCPYCLEDVKEGALVCRACRRDLAFFSPLLNQINNLQIEVSKLSAKVDTLENRTSQAPAPRLSTIKAPMSELAAYVVVLGVCFIEGLAYFCLKDLHKEFWVRFLGFIVVPPAIWIGYTGSFRLRFIIILGLVEGLLSALITLFVFYSGIAFQFSLRGLLYNVGQALKYLGIPAFFLFLASTWFGNWLARRRKGIPFSIPSKVANTLTTRGSGESSVVYDRRIQRITQVISAVGPILTLIGSIVVAYFGYLGATSKAVAAK